MKNISLFLLFTSFFLISSSQSFSELYKRAPDALPGTTIEMLDPQYWISKMKNPDQVILTVPQILSMNENYIKKMSRKNPFDGIPAERIPSDRFLYRFPGHFLVYPDLTKMNPSELSVLVKSKIKEDIDYLKKQPFGDFFSVPYPQSKIDSFEKEMAADNIPGEIKLLEGIALITTQLRIVPTFFPNEVGINAIGKDNYTIDLWTSSLVKIGRPVRILYRSLSGSHVFVLSDMGFGWVDSRYVALGNAGDIKNFSDPKDFIICTGDNVPFYTDKSCVYVSGWLRMGDRMPLMSKGNPRLIGIPMKSEDGKLVTGKAWLSENADVSTGYLPYTRKNVVVTAFKLLGNPYDWTESSIGRNHESTWRDIFACFGFRLPYHGSLFTFFGDYSEAAMPGIGAEKIYEMVLGHEPFVTLMTSHSHGHTMLLLGEYNGKAIAFDNNGYSYKDESGTEYQIKRTTLVDMTIPAYFFKSPITFLELK